MEREELDGNGRVRALIEAAISEGVFPGAAWAFNRRGRRATGYAGRHTYCQDAPLIGPDTLWDLASLSKVIGTTSAAMRLVARGKLDLEAPVASVLPEFGAQGKDRIRFRNLLLHDAGLVPFRPFHQTLRDPDAVWTAVCRESLQYETGTKTVYSDLSMIALARAMEVLDGRRLDVHLREDVFGPLGMSEARYFDTAAVREASFATRPADEPLVAAMRRCAPASEVEGWRTELRHARYGRIGSSRVFGDAPTYIQGEVHDPTATVLGGIAGHAGLFATLEDGVRFVDGLLANRVTDRATVERFVRRQGEGSSRALGWDTNWRHAASAGKDWPETAFGHTGYTGTSIWVDVERGDWALLFTNRVHPDDNAKILDFRPRFHSAVAAAFA